MVKAILQLLLIFLLLVILLTFEAVIGLPIIFLTVFALLAVMLAKILWLPLLLFLATSFMVAVVFQLPVVVAFILLVGLVIFTTKGQLVVKQKSMRIIVGVIVVTGVIVALNPLTLGELGAMTTLLQTLISLALIWRSIGNPIKGSRSMVKYLGTD